MAASGRACGKSDDGGGACSDLAGARRCSGEFFYGCVWICADVDGVDQGAVSTEYVVGVLELEKNLEGRHWVCILDD